MSGLLNYELDDEGLKAPNSERNRSVLPTWRPKVGKIMAFWVIFLKAIWTMGQYSTYCWGSGIFVES